MGSAVDRLRKKVYGTEEPQKETKKEGSAVKRLQDIVNNGANYTVNPENSYANRVKQSDRGSAAAPSVKNDDEPNFFDRVGNVLTGAGRSTASDYTNLGGTATEGLGRIGSRLQDKKEARLAAQDREYLERYKKDLAAAQAAGDERAAKIAQTRINQAEYRLKQSGVLGDYYDQVNQEAVQKIYSKADELGAAAQQDIDEAKEGLGGAGKFLVDAGVAGTQLAGDMALAMLSGGSTTVPMALRVMGGSAGEARQDGATYGQQLAYGAGSALVSGLTEKLGNVGGVFKTAFGAGVLDKALAKVAAKPAGKLLAGAISEGGEEFIEALAQPLLQKLTYNPEAVYDEEWLSEALYSAAIGAVLGGGGVAISPSTYAREPRTQIPEAETGAGAQEQTFEGKDIPPTENAAEDLKMATEGVRPEDTLRTSTLEMAKKTLGEKGYQAFESAYRDSDDAATTYGELTRAYNEGMTGRKTGSRTLTEAQYDAMYQAGKADADASVEAQAKQAGYATVHGKDSGLVYDSYVSQNVDAKTAKTVNTVAKALGVKVQFADSVAGGSANAQIEDGIVTIEKGNKNPVRFLFGHEITHRMQELAPAEYARLREAVTAGGWADAAIKGVQSNYAQHGMAIGSEAALDEAVADYVGTLLEDSGELERFIRKHQDDRSLLQKLRDAFRDLARKLRGSQYDKQIRNVEKRLSETLDAAVAQVKTNEKAQKNTTQKSGVRHSFKGYDPVTGRGIYESNFPMGTPRAAKADRILDYIQNVWSKQPIDLVIQNKDGTTREIKAQFDPTYDSNPHVLTDASKLMGGNRHGTAAERRVTLDLADDYYQIASEAVYNYSKNEEGKDKATHAGVKEWHYFINDILFQEYGETKTTPYRVTINVKERSDGSYVYSFNAERQNERPSTRRTLHADVTPTNVGGNAQPSETKVAQPEEIVKGGADEVLFSLKYDREFMKAAMDANGSSKRVSAATMKEASRVRQAVADIFNDPDLAESLGLPPDIIGNTYIPNGSYSGTEENTTECIRSIAADDLMDAVAEYLGRPLTVEDTIAISQEYWKYTDRPECLYCYVAMDRKAHREFLGSYMQQRDDAIRNVKNGMSKEEAYQKFLDGRKDTAPMKKRFNMWMQNMDKEMITPADLASRASMQSAAERGANIKAQVNDALKYAQSASWAKKRISYSAYNNHILKWKKTRIDNLNSNYGLRMYSFSDFSPAFILENMQMITDAAVRGLKVLAYTKELDFVKIFAKTGMNINISVFGYDDGHGGVAMDGMQGADWAEAQALRETYDNVGCTFVATNDKQVAWALDQDWIDVIIPFHMVRTGTKVAEHFGWKNYTAMSADTRNKDWTKADAKHILPPMHQNDKAKYLQACKDNHLTPRFNDWVDHPNYMKLVNETRRSEGKTKPVQPVFDLDAAKASIDLMRRQGGYYKPIGGSRENMLDVAEEIADVIKAKGTKFSLKDIDTSGMDDNAKAVVRELRQEAVGMRVLNSIASMTPERFKSVYRGSISTDPNYAHDYIAWVRPMDFVNATTTDYEAVQHLRAETGDLDPERLLNYDMPMWLTVDMKTGEIVGHEGRHRMLALDGAGVTKVPVVIKTINFDRNNAEPIADMKLTGQEFLPVYGSNRAPRGTDFWLHNAMPLSQKYGKIAYQLFCTTEKPGRIRYSLKDSESVAREIARIQKEGKAQKRSESAIQADIRVVVEEAYQAMSEEYGTIDPGENPAREVQVPKKTGKKKVSQTVRTVMEAGATPDEVLPNLEQLVATGAFSYDAYSDKAAIADAHNSIEKVGWAQALADWTAAMKRGEVSKKNTAMGWALYNNAVNSGDVDTALTVLDHMVKHQRNAAQALQATRILKKLSPETQLYQVQRSVESLQEELNERYGDKKAPELKIDPELAERYMKSKDQEERDEVMKDIYRDVGRQLPSRFIDKWNAWRYLAMLGNPRTHVRNVVGNAGFAPVVATKNLTATAIEAVVSRVSGGKLNRTKSLVGFSKNDRALLKAAWDDFAKIQDAAMSGGKYNDFANANQYIEDGKQVFKFKPLEAARKGNTKAMEKEDMWFSRPHYAAALAGYCKQHGLTPEQIAKGKETKNARAYAIKEAQKATYRDTNALSQTISELGKPRAGETNPVKKGVGVVMEGILPFRKTPANILARGLEYSPVGLMNGIKQAVFDVKRGKKTGAEAIDSISSGLTGTGLLALGMYLAAQGLIRGHGDDDDKENEFKELMGHQAYALEVGDTSVTLDWLAPECLPLFIGVNLWEQTDGEAEEMTLSVMLTAVKTVTEPLLEMSCLQSLNDVFDSVGYAASEGLDGLPAALASAATSYLTQGLPTILGQAERTGEGVRMTTYTEKNAFLTGDMQYTLGKASARIPGPEYQQIPYIDAWGRTESSGGTGERAFNNFLNPAYTSEINTSKMEEELLRLYEETGEGSVLPSRASKYFVVNKERKDLTAEEYVKYAKKKGQTSYDLATKLTSNKQYSSMNTEQRVKAVEEVYDYANQTAKASISKYKVESWVAKAQEAQKQHGISPDVYTCLKVRASDFESLKDKSGESIDNSKGLQVMLMVYDTPGLTDDQRQAMFEYLGVGKGIRHYNKKRVELEIEKAKKKAK